MLGLFGKKKRRKKSSSGWKKHLWTLVLAAMGMGSGAGYNKGREFPILKDILQKVAPQVQTTLEKAREYIDTPQEGPIHVYFTKPGAPPAENEAIARAVVGYIDKTQQTLDVAAFELDNKIITEALVRAVQRGVKVRLVTETNYIKESGVVALQSVGVTVVDDKRDNAFMHNKFMVFDNKAVWTGSMNFTENCAYRNNNNGIYIESTQLAENYATKFGWMFEQKKFGAAPSRSAKIPNPVIRMADGTVIENYFSTHDHVGEHVIEKLNDAKNSIHFLAFSFTHDGISRAMLQKAASRIPVQGVFEKSQCTGGYTEYNRMKAYGPGVEVYYDANPRNMHHKVMVIDGTTTVTGSYNFSTNAEKSNDENVLIIQSPAIAQKYEEEFQRVFGAGKAAEASGGPIAQGPAPHNAKK